MTANVQALRQRHQPTTPPPTRTPEREELRRAQEQHRTAHERLAKIRDAAERASTNSSNLFHAVRQAKVAVEEAEASEGRYLAAVALNETDASGSPIKAAAERLAQTEADYNQNKRTQQALEKEAEAAERELSWAVREREEAHKAVVKTDPATRRLIDDYKRVQAEYLDACKLIAALGELGCCVLDRFGEGYSTQQGSPPVAPAWQAAIEKLKTDADAQLPQE